MRKSAETRKSCIPNALIEMHAWGVFVLLEIADHDSVISRTQRASGVSKYRIQTVRNKQALHVHTLHWHAHEHIMNLNSIAARAVRSDVPTAAAVRSYHYNMQQIVKKFNSVKSRLIAINAIKHS